MVKVTGVKLDIDDVSLKDGSIDKISVRAVFSKQRKGAGARYPSVKINSELLIAVEEFINLDENKFRYVNRKQFVDIAVADFLRREKRKVKK